MNIIPRSEWGARPPKFQRRLYTLRGGWFWHWLGYVYPEQMSDPQILRSVQRIHMDVNGWSDIAYNFAIGRDLGVYELRGYDIAGGATRYYNNTSMAIVFLVGPGEEPTPEMYQLAWELVATRPAIEDDVRGHKDVSATACPGPDIHAEIHNPQHQEPTMMTPEEAAYHVDWGYEHIIAVTPDPSGRQWWIDQLVAGTWTVNNMRWEFASVRFAADKAALEAVTSANPVAVDLAVVADQTYQLFMQDLARLR